jgi:hypothetical protein
MNDPRIQDDEPLDIRQLNLEEMYEEFEKLLKADPGYLDWIEFINARQDETT